MQPMLSAKRVARTLGIEEDTLALWRRRSYGPRWYKVGRLIKYGESDIKEWLASQQGQRTEHRQIAEVAR
jgi:predicted DNA-binding transcriptional regulator AlpA